MRYQKIQSCFILLVLLLTACSSPRSTVAPSSPTPEIVLTATETPIPPTATPIPPRNLVICLGQEPSTLYLYGGSSRSMWSVLEAIYDGPIDTRQFTPQPVILKEMPSLANGSAQVQAVTVKEGDEVIATQGDLVNLSAGVQVYPSGCRATGCAVTWDGKSSLQMDRMVLNFKLLPGLKWSDGEALTAEDSVFSYQVAASPDTPVSRHTADHTDSYQALDPQTVQWIGKPGEFPLRYDAYFWSPLPKHLLEKYSPKELLTAEESTLKPLGWGPYIIEDWVQGDHIQLRKNPNYFRASKGLPKFDILTYRFLGEPLDNNLAALLAGECDVVDQTSLLDEQLEPILELQKSGKLKAFIAQGPEWEHLDFGIKPASYDNGYSPYGGDRPDFFSDGRVRQAFAYCTDRQKIVDKLLHGASSIPASFEPPTSPLFLKDLAPLPFDVSVGSQLLDEVGWKDLDGDPKTPRLAVGVSNVIDQTPLAVTYVTTQAALRMEVAKVLVDSLAQCGIQVTVKYLNPGELYAPGPEGVLFGRKFDLAQFAWGAGTQSPCFLYQTDQIPTLQNNWLTVNVTGFSNAEYDQVCQAARLARPEDADYLEKNQVVQRLFASELPVIPLYFRIKMAITRTDLCGFELDPSARSALWNLEVLDRGQDCQ